MAEDKKISTEETENNIKNEEKRDNLDALLFDDEGEDYDETSDEVEFDAFMAEYRDLISNKFNSATAEEPQAVEDEDPEEVLISLPKKPAKKKKKESTEKKSDGSDWDEKITLAPEEYEDPAEDDKEMVEEMPEDDAPDFDLGEEEIESDDKFQISINFGADGDGEVKSNEDTDDEDAVHKYDPEKPRIIDWVFDIAEMFVFVLLAVMILTSFVFRHSIVEGHSMMNTLSDGDHLIISDLFYTPERGDIIVFEDYSTSLRKAVVKRVIALPGETVEVRFNEEGDVVAYVNGELLAEEYSYNAKDCNIDITNFNKPIVLGDDEIFVMGDNRYHSTDSRVSSVGPIKTDAILGKVIIRFFPFNSFGTVE